MLILPPMVCNLYAPRKMKGIAMKTFNSLCLLLVLCSASSAWLNPENAGGTVNSPYNEWYPTIASDGSFMIFVSNRPGGYGGSDLWISMKEDDSWGTPVNLGPEVNTPGIESAPFLAENDTMLYFFSMDPNGHGGGDIWFCAISGGVPGAKVNLPPPINTPDLECCPIPSHDGTRFYFCSERPGGHGGVDVWLSEFSGETWGEPRNAGLLVNGTGTDCPRWISDDDQTLIICSTSPGGYGGSDLYQAQVEGDTLGCRSNLGPVLNSSADEWGAGFQNNQGYVGGTIFFGSARPGGLGGLDIWYSNETPELLTAISWGRVKTCFTHLVFDGNPEECGNRSLSIGH